MVHVQSWTFYDFPIDMISTCTTCVSQLCKQCLHCKPPEAVPGEGPGPPTGGTRGVLPARYSCQQGWHCYGCMFLPYPSGNINTTSEPIFGHRLPSWAAPHVLNSGSPFGFRFINKRGPHGDHKHLLVSYCFFFSGYLSLALVQRASLHHFT